MYSQEPTTDISFTEKETLDRDGFLILPNLIDSPQIGRICKELSHIQDYEPNLQNQSCQFDICFMHHKIMNGVFHVVKKDFISAGLHFRPNNAGEGLSALHIAYGGAPRKPGDYVACSVLWMISDFTQENGCTRAVPGSHRWGRSPSEVMRDPTQPNPHEIFWEGKAGTAVIFNGHLWHSTTVNHTNNKRLAIVAYWRRQEISIVERGFNWGVINQDTAHRLGPHTSRLFQNRGDI